MAARRGGAGVSGAVMGWFVDSHDFSLRASPPRHDCVTITLVQGPGDCSGRVYIQVQARGSGRAFSAHAELQTPTHQGTAAQLSNDGDATPAIALPGPASSQYR